MISPNPIILRVLNQEKSLEYIEFKSLTISKVPRCRKVAQFAEGQRNCGRPRSGTQVSSFPMECLSAFHRIKVLGESLRGT